MAHADCEVANARTDAAATDDAAVTDAAASAVAAARRSETDEWRRRALEAECLLRAAVARMASRRNRRQYRFRIPLVFEGGQYECRGE